jgi:hypothetical protein
MPYAPSGSNWNKDRQKSIFLGRAIAQAVTRLLPIVAASVRSQIRRCGICGRQSGTGVGLLRVLPFSMPSTEPPILNHFIIEAIYCNGFDQCVARQQLCKQGTLSSNRGGCVFYVVRAKQLWERGSL